VNVTRVVGYLFQLWDWGFCVVGRWFCLAAASNFQVSGFFNTFFGETWDIQIDRFLFETFENPFFMTTIW
jgi:hypothetical protein